MVQLVNAQKPLFGMVHPVGISEKTVTVRLTPDENMRNPYLSELYGPFDKTDKITIGRINDQFVVQVNQDKPQPVDHPEVIADCLHILNQVAVMAASWRSVILPGSKKAPEKR